MLRSCAAAAAILLVCGAAQAQEPANMLTLENSETAVGIGIMCNTPEQALHYISLLVGGQEREPAMAAVNAQQKNPRACGVATVAFKRDATVDSQTVRGQRMEIVRIIVSAGFNGTVWRAMSGTVQYAVMESKGISI